jgi:fibronectin-binding autotransporter adhesin
MRAARFRFAALGTIASFVLTVAAAANAGTTYSWYSAGSAGGQGDSGTWDTTNAYWSYGGNYYAWPNTTDYIADFGGTAGTVSLDGAAITAGGLTIETSGYSLTTGTLNLGGNGITTTYALNSSTVGAAIVLQASQTWTVGAGTSLFINGAISGGAGATLTKSGTGTVTLLQDNSYTGGTNIYGGVLQISNHTTPAAGTIPGDVYLGDSTNGTGTLAFNRYSAASPGFSFDGVISGDGAVIQYAGTLTLTQHNTYTGPTTVIGSSLNEGIDDALPDGPLTVGTGNPIFRMMGHTDSVGLVTLTTGSITGPGTLASTVGFNVVKGFVSAVLAGSVDLTKTGDTSTVTLASASVYTGTTYVNAGALAYGADGATGPGNLFVAGGILNLGVYSGTAATVTLGTDTGDGTIAGSGTLTSTGGFTVCSGSVSAVLAGSVGLTKLLGFGTVTLSQNNTYTGTTTIYGGALQLGSGGVGGAFASSAVNTGDSTNGTGTLVFAYAASTTSYDHVISGDGAVNQVCGTLTLSQNNTYTGATNVSYSAGSLTTALRVTGSIASSSGVSVGSGASLILDGGVASSVSLTGGATLVMKGGTASSVYVSVGAALVGYGAAGSVNVDMTGILGSATDNTLWGEKLTTTSLALQGVNYVNIGNIGSYATGPAIDVTQNNSLTLGGTIYMNLYGTAPVGTGTVTLIRCAGTVDGSLSYFQLSESFASTRSTYTLSTVTSGGFTKINLIYGVDYPYWTGLGNCVWSTDIQSPKNWKLVSSGSQTDYIEGDAVLFDDRVNAGTTTFAATVTLGQNVNPGGVTFDNSGSVSYTITSGTDNYGIGGTTSLTKNGAGTATIRTANSYYGPTNVNAGALNVQNDAALGSSTVTVAAGGTLQLQGGVSVSNLLTLNGTLQNVADANTWSGDIAVNAAGSITVSSNSLTVIGAISGLGSLTKNGAGTLTLSGAGTNTVAVTAIYGGTLQVGDGTATGNLVSNITTGDGTHGTGTLVFNRTGICYVTGPITGSGAVVKLGSGTVNLLQDNNYTGGTSIYGGVLLISNHTTPAAGTIAGDVYTGNATDGTGTLAFNRYSAVSPDFSFDGVISGYGDVIQYSGTLTLTQHNTYTGSTLVKGSSLNEGIDDALPDGPLTVGTGNPIFRMMGHTDSVGLVTLTSGSICGPGTLASTVGFTLKRSYVSAVLAGDVGLTMAGAGTDTCTLYAPCTYTGPTIITGGCLAYGVDNAVGSNSVAVNATSYGGTLNLGSYSGTVGAVSIGTYNSGAGTGTSGTISGSGALTSNVGFTVYSGSVTAALAGAVGLTKTGGTGTNVCIANVCTYTGTTSIYAGTLTLGNYGAKGSVAGDIYTGDPTNGTGTLRFYHYVSGNTDTYSRVISGDGAVAQTAGTLVLAAHNTYTGLTTVYASTLHEGIDDALGTGDLTVTGNSIFRMMGHTDSVGAVTLTYGKLDGAGTLTSTVGFTLTRGSVTGATLAGSVDLTKDTAAYNVVVASANLYTGATYINGGTLTLYDQNAVQNSTLTPNGGRLVFHSAVSANAFTFGGLAAAASGTGYDVALQNNAGTPVVLTVGGNNASTTYAGVLSGAGSLTKTGSGSLTLSGANTYTGATYVNGGFLVIQGTAATAAILGGTSTDIGAGKLVFDYAAGGSATGATISDQVKSILTASYNGGTNSWASGAIHSTLANSHSTDSYALGWSNNTATSAVTVKVVLYGDATMDGTVNIYDLGQVLANYNKSGTWATGDFNYDGTVNIYDLGTVLANYNKSLSLSEASIDPSDYAGLDGQGVAALQAAGVNVVPEPGMLALLTAGAIGLLAHAWRKRKRWMIH